jgi:DNA (cytosine-5)-methyltransferase 1
VADGGSQFGFNFPRNDLAKATSFALLNSDEMVVDLFAGGGGAGQAIKEAIGRDPDLAINHDPLAIGMHAANHPQTRHMIEDIYEVCPLAATAGRWIGWLHASPDCTHFSQALGGQPRSRATRSLSWVVLKWAGKMAKAGRPIRIISIENVEQILKWGPLIAKRDKVTGRVIKLVRVPTGKFMRDGTPKMKTIHVVAAAGERVPVQDQFLVPDKKRQGQTWCRFIGLLRSIGAKSIEWQKRWVASRHGAGTTRSRLFAVVRFDDRPIVWPDATYGSEEGLEPTIVAADSIDFTDLGKSIFGRKRPLKDKTCRRIARGTKDFVIDNAEPFFIPLTHCGDIRVYGGNSPFPAITAANRGELAGIYPVLAPFINEHANSSTQRVHRADESLRTLCAGVKGGHFSVVTPHLVKFRGDSKGAEATNPMPAITSGAGAERPAGAAHALGMSTAHLVKLRGTSNAAGANEPVHAISAGGEHHGVVRCELTDGSGLTPEHEACALRVASFLIKYYGTAHGESLTDPLDTATTKDRLALVTVWIQGDPFVIVDITLRMLKPRELFNAQGFPRDYIIDRTADGRKLTKSEQVRMVGNSVSPPALRVIVRANLDTASEPMAMAA